MPSKGRILDGAKETKHSSAIRKDLEHCLIGQPNAIDYYIGLIETYRSGLSPVGRPIGSVLFTGPTGSGKTFSAESFAESLQNRLSRSWKNNLMRIDCGEFQHSHEIAKLLGSPPGYLGHRETKPMLSSERLKALETATMEYQFAILVFDEIEKASDSLWNILLAILDKASLTLGSNEQVDLQKTVIIMTSNAGFSDRRDGLGFAPSSVLNSAETARIGITAAKRKFSVEFINRLDGVIAFDALTTDHVKQIIKLELGKLQLEIFTKGTPKIIVNVTENAQEQLLKAGYDPKYNARGIKREIDKQLRLPIARILGGCQLLSHEGVLVDFKKDEYTFRAISRTEHDFIVHGDDTKNGGDIL